MTQGADQGAAVESHSHDVQRQTVAALYRLQLQNREDIIRRSRGRRSVYLCLICILTDEMEGRGLVTERT